jgi:hypothetical protein
MPWLFCGRKDVCDMGQLTMTCTAAVIGSTKKPTAEAGEDAENFAPQWEWLISLLL